MVVAVSMVTVYRQRLGSHDDEELRRVQSAVAVSFAEAKPECLAIRRRPVRRKGRLWRG